MLEINFYIGVRFFIFVVGVLISLSFLTLLERKLLGYCHLRKGPNKVGIIGVFQPFRDAIKLFRKESIIFRRINKYIYMGSSLFLLVYILIA